MNPGPALQQDVSKEALDQVGHVADDEDRHDRQRCKCNQRTDNGHAKHPQIETVKSKRDPRLAAGTEREICGVGKSMDGRCRHGNAQETDRQ